MASRSRSRTSARATPRSRTSPKGEAILTGILALSQSLGLEVVTEGVETTAQQTFLARHGELEIQGWLHSKALPAAELAAWLDRRRCGDLVVPRSAQTT